MAMPQSEFAYYSQFSARADRDWQRLLRKSKSTTPYVWPVLSPGQQIEEHEAEARRKLKYLRNIIADIDRATGKERERLIDLKFDKLDELIEKYKDTNAGVEAKKILAKN